MAGAAADVEHGRRGRRQVLEQLVVHHIGAHVPLDGGVRLIGKLIGQAGPGVFAHDLTIQVSS